MILGHIHVANTRGFQAASGDEELRSAGRRGSNPSGGSTVMSPCTADDEVEAIAVHQS